MANVFMNIDFFFFFLRSFFLCLSSCYFSLDDPILQIKNGENKKYLNITQYIQIPLLAANIAVRELEPFFSLEIIFCRIVTFVK